MRMVNEQGCCKALTVVLDTWISAAIQVYYWPKTTISSPAKKNNHKLCLYRTNNHKLCSSKTFHRIGIRTESDSNCRSFNDDTTCDSIFRIILENYTTLTSVNFRIKLRVSFLFVDIFFSVYIFVVQLQNSVIMPGSNAYIKEKKNEEPKAQIDVLTDENKKLKVHLRFTPMLAV